MINLDTYYCIANNVHEVSTNKNVCTFSQIQLKIYKVAVNFSEMWSLLCLNKSHAAGMISHKALLAKGCFYKTNPSQNSVPLGMEAVLST